MSENDEKKFTQEDVNKIVGERLKNHVPKADFEALQAKNKELETANSKLTIERDTLKTKVEELESAGKTEVEKANAKAEAVAKELADMKAAAEKREKYDAGIKEINSKVSEAQLGKGAAEYVAVNFRPGDDPVKFLETHMPLMKTSYPPPNVGDGGRGSGNPPKTSFTRQQIKDMTPEEFSKNESAIHEAMAKGEIK
ncbi:MAG: hypothetical protein PHU82_02665 [Candidatus Pacebacteria bacterium]|jgi:regulator of replication initiation timing|nr:hypothetical protein [Candidatus Paceibacterota bacterium]MDD5535529.1 hypothetical protein [Candidatus Paceibacterota bacterium]DBA35106.1 TPA_asm: hypothetical protein vir515_00021 [Caudoviricetes sp. vir515]